LRFPGSWDGCLSFWDGVVGLAVVAKTVGVGWSAGRTDQLVLGRRLVAPWHARRRAGLLVGAKWPA